MPEAEGRVTLWGIEVFLAIAEEGAISAAARRLGVSVSAASQQLTGLEAALGATLLDRGARPLRLTPAGAMFRRHAQTMLNAATEARAELAMADLSGLTTLRLGMIEDFDGNVTPPLLATLAQDLRGCRFLLETGASHRLLDGLEARALDLVVAADLGTEGAGDDWRESHPLLSDPFVAVRPQGAAPDLPLILYSPRHLMGRQIGTHLQRHGMRATHRFELDSYQAILSMVAAGAGWTILTPLALRHVARFYGALDVAPLPAPLPPLARSLSLSARSGVLRDLPQQTASHLRRLIEAEIVAPALADWPWLAGALRVLPAG